MTIDRTATATDVVVVGAGPAGLRAATSLRRCGRSVIVLEARDRVGGRLCSVPVSGGGLDLGATWFWPNEQRVASLADRLGLQRFAQHQDGDMMYQTPDGTHRVAGNQIDVPSGRIAQGTQSLADGLAALLPPGVIRYDDPVQRVGLADGALDVVAERSKWSAPHVVIAVPPATAVANISIDRLDREVRSVAVNTPVWMGGTVKVVAQYGHPFWRDDGLAGSAFSHVGPLREVHDMSGPGGAPAALFGFAQPGPDAAAPERAKVIEQLASLFGPQAVTPMELWIHDWRTERYSVAPESLVLSDYSTYGHRLFQEPVLEGRLHWASTETAVEAPGHIEGALAAADRAVEAVLRAPYRPCLSAP